MNFLCEMLVKVGLFPGRPRSIPVHMREQDFRDVNMSLMQMICNRDETAVKETVGVSYRSKRMERPKKVFAMHKRQNWQRWFMYLRVGAE